MMFGSDVYPLRLFPDRRLVPVREQFPGRHPGQQARRLGRADRGRAGRGAGAVLPAHQDRARAARRRRRSRRRAVGRHSARLDLVRGLAGRRPRRAGRGDGVGHQARRAVLHHVPGAEGAAGADHRRLHLGARRHRRRADRRRRREARRGLSRARSSAAASNTGSPTCWRWSCCWCGRRACSASASSSGFEGSKCVLYRETGQFKTSYAADMAIFPIRQDRIALWAAADLCLHRRAGARRVPGLAARAANICCAPSSFRS